MYMRLCVVHVCLCNSLPLSHYVYVCTGVYQYVCISMCVEKRARVCLCVRVCVGVCMNTPSLRVCKVWERGDRGDRGDGRR